MKEIKNLNFDLLEIVKHFDLSHNENCEHLFMWLQANYELDDFEQRILNDLYDEVSVSGEYMNEEEIKAKMVSLIFYASKVTEPKKIGLFYERAISGTVKNLSLSVICDCLIAMPRVNAPDVPYFFLQEFKKAKGEKKDPEAQMLIAMILAQHKNNDNKPIYGGYLLGTGWHFSTLIGNDYCISRRFEASKKDDLAQIIYIIRKLKALIINR